MLSNQYMLSQNPSGPPQSKAYPCEDMLGIAIMQEGEAVWKEERPQEHEHSLRQRFSWNLKFGPLPTAWLFPLVYDNRVFSFGFFLLSVVDTSQMQLQAITVLYLQGLLNLSGFQPKDGQLIQIFPTSEFQFSHLVWDPWIFIFPFTFPFSLVGNPY